MSMSSGWTDGTCSIRSRGRAVRRPDAVSDAPTEPREPETAYDQQELGDALCNEGRVREAVVHYRKAVEMEADNPSYHTRLGDAYAYSEMSIKAVAEYRKALKISPRRAEPHYSLAEIYRRYGKWMAAVEEYRKATQFNSMNPFYRYKLGDALWHVGPARRSGDAARDGGADRAVRMVLPLLARRSLCAARAGSATRSSRCSRRPSSARATPTTASGWVCSICKAGYLRRCGGGSEARDRAQAGRADLSRGACRSLSRVRQSRASGGPLIATRATSTTTTPRTWR